MDTTHRERGATLIEALVAGGLLITMATGTATLVALARRLNARAEELMAATAVASARTQALRAVPWHYDINGASVDVAALDVAPAGALDRDTPGWFETTDEAGRPVTEPGAASPAFVVRWATWPVPASTGDTRVTEVCVFAAPGAAGAPPLVCLDSARTRQP